MDTVSHIIIGLGLGALAQLDPAVAENDTLSNAIMLGTVIGSNAPDFDFIYRFKGRSSYARHHRGISHSLISLPLWSIAVSGFIFPFFPDVSFSSLFLWTFLAVIVHVFFDLFNVHGTQILLPFTRKKISFDSLPLMDPFILIVHLSGFCLFPFFMPGRIFLIIYIVLFLYLVIRFLSAQWTKRHLQQHFVRSIRIKVIPRAVLFKWDVIIETNDDFLFGVYTRNSLFIEYTLSNKNDFPELVLESKQDQDVSEFLTAAAYVHPFVRKSRKGYFILWKDLRFRKNTFFPVIAITFIPADFKTKKSFIGQLSSLKQYKKVLRNLINTANESATENLEFKGVSDVGDKNMRGL